MKNDTTSTLLNFILAALVIMGVLFAVLGIVRQRELNHLMPELQLHSQIAQVNLPQAQMLLNDALAYNTKAQNADLARILASAQRPAAPAAAK
jgi:hypothetical protein